MAKGNKIVVAAEPLGRFLDVIVDGTPKPGTMMELTPATEPENGRPHVRVYQPGTDGDRKAVMILCEDELQGVAATVAYTDGYYGRVYFPAMGEEINVLLANIAGTGDSHAIGELLIADTGTGKFIATTGSPESEPFEIMETVEALTADALACAIYTGH